MFSGVIYSKTGMDTINYVSGIRQGFLQEINPLFGSKKIFLLYIICNDNVELMEQYQLEG